MLKKIIRWLSEVRVTRFEYLVTAPLGTYLFFDDKILWGVAVYLLSGLIVVMTDHV